MRTMIATFWQHEFAWRLSRAAQTQIKVRDLKRVMARLPTAAMPGSDAAKRFNLVLARSLQAAVVYLEGDMALPKPQALSVARTAFLASGSWVARNAIRTWLVLERDPFAGVEKRDPSGFAKAMWGEGMDARDRRAPGEVSLCVTRCPFHEYFWNAGRSELTPILCAWDTAWQQEINSSRKPLRVVIRSTLAAGGSQCEFTFQRTETSDGAL